MAKLSISLLFFVLAFTTFIPPSQAAFSSPITREQVGLKDDQTTQTHLTFYFHDVVSGSSPKVAQIAKASSTDTSSTQFGALSMIDDPLTEAQDNSSRLVGRAQGMYASADLTNTALTMVMNFVFLVGDYNGSTLAVLGRNPVGEGVRELPVVGGTGAFRFAKGYAQARTQTFDQSTGNAVVKYDVYVSHSNSSTAGGSGSGGSGGSGFGPPGSSGSTSSAPDVGLGRVSYTLASLLLVAILYLV